MKKNQDQSMRLDGQLCFALYASSLAMTKAYQKHLQSAGLTYPQYLVMLVLWEHLALSVSEIGELLFLDSGTLTPLLKRLETAGHIKRKRSPEDERRVMVELTSKGKQLKSKLSDVPERMLKTSQCSRLEAKKLTQQLKLLSHSLREN
jgi:DNA-binding MarR family transcriptional regulator